MVAQGFLSLMGKFRLPLGRFGYSGLKGKLQLLKGTFQ